MRVPLTHCISETIVTFTGGFASSRCLLYKRLIGRAASCLLQIIITFLLNSLRKKKLFATERKSGLSAYSPSTSVSSEVLLTLDNVS